MQSPTDNTPLFYSCVQSLKRSVMGCCYSLCHKDTEAEEGTQSERTQLLAEVVREDIPQRTAVATATPRKPDEQTALNRILQETATNVIDVGALGPHVLEAHEYGERVRAYQARLGAAAVLPPTPCLLRDVPHTELMQALQADPLASYDKDLILSAVRKAAAAISELRVDHREDLVVPFKIS